MHNTVPPYEYLFPGYWEKGEGINTVLIQLPGNIVKMADDT